MLNRVVVLSLEPWDQTWRRNQHLASRLVSDGHVRYIQWVSPAVAGRTRRVVERPQRGVTVLVPPLLVPRRLGGLRLLARSLAGVIRGADVLWVNEPRLGAACLRHGVPAVYDVTDDWRCFPTPPRVLRRLIAAEDRLAVDAATVVCSQTLAERWEQRYGLAPPVVNNGVDLRAHAAARPREVLRGTPPHVGYVGTLQPERLDLNLVLRAAALPEVGTLHLIGPDALGTSSRAVLETSEKIQVHPPVPATEVPSIMSVLDVLISPHLVNSFTLSLDAIKAYEYAASRRPVVATPTSGFQLLTELGVAIGVGDDFLRSLRAAVRHPEEHAVRPVPGSSWEERTASFAVLLGDARTAAAA